MNQVNTYKNPPIKEAIFVVTFAKAIDNKLLEEFRNSKYILQNYPLVKPTFNITIDNPKHQATNNPEINKSHDGYSLECGENCKRLIRVRQTHISFHNFTDYIGWDNMLADFKEIWNSFCTTVGKQNVSQLNIRYINQINLPQPFTNGIGQYLNLTPTIPNGINPNLNSFFIQINVSNSLNTLQGVITETILPQPFANQKTLTVLLDISVVKTGNFICNEKPMWDSFEEIRIYKDELFENCITQETKNLFNNGK